MYKDYQDKLCDSLEKTVFLAKNQITSWNKEDAFKAVLQYFFVAKKAQNQVFFIGNGGSAAIASHMTIDFMKNGGMRTNGLYDPSVITCIGNDYGYEHIFSKQIYAVGNAGDLLVAISSSGNSKNIINAINAATERKMQTITFTGFKCDNLVKQLGDMNVYVPICQYGIVESIHNLLLQQVVDVITAEDGVEF